MKDAKEIVKEILILMVCGMVAISSCNLTINTFAKKSNLYDKTEVKEHGLKVPTPLYTEKNLDLLARLLMAENGSNKDEATWLTGVVVLKRVKSEDYPNSVRGVIYQKGQYSTAKNLYKVVPNEKCLEIAEELLIYGVDDYPDGLVYQSMFKQGKEVYKEINGEYFCIK